jgi:hypothetical protein
VVLAAGMGGAVLREALFDVRHEPPGVRRGGRSSPCPRDSQPCRGHYGRSAVSPSRVELLATVPDELMGSAGKATEERRQLGGDTKNGAFDDADDRGDEAAEKGSSRHESTSLSGPPSCRKVLFVAATATYSSKHKLASDC